MPGFRGAGQPGLLRTQPLGRHPHPDLWQGREGKRIEFRCPDTAANPYLLFSALLMAGLDGVKNKIDPGAPADFDLYEASAKELAKIKSTPGSLREVLMAPQGGSPVPARRRSLHQVLIDTWIDYKIDQRSRSGQPAPHPVRVLPLLRRLGRSRLRLNTDRRRGGYSLPRRFTGRNAHVT